MPWLVLSTLGSWFSLRAASVSLSFFFFSSRRRHTRLVSDWSSNVCSSDLGAGELRGFEERARYMIAIAQEALALIRPEPKERFSRWISREPIGVVLVIAPWNYPYLKIGRASCRERV